VDGFRGFAEGGAVDEGDFLALLAVGGGKPAVHRQAELDHGGLVGQIPKLWVAREISQKHDSVVTGHGKAPYSADCSAGCSSRRARAGRSGRSSRAGRSSRGRSRSTGWGSTASISSLLRWSARVMSTRRK